MEQQQPTFTLGSVFARTNGALHKLRRDRRGAEFVEVLIVLSIIALGGITAMGYLRDRTGDKAKEVGDKIVSEY